MSDSSYDPAPTPPGRVAKTVAAIVPLTIAGLILGVLLMQVDTPILAALRQVSDRFMTGLALVSVVILALTPIVTSMMRSHHDLVFTTLGVSIMFGIMGMIGTCLRYGPDPHYAVDRLLSDPGASWIATADADRQSITIWQITGGPVVIGTAVLPETRVVVAELTAKQAQRLAVVLQQHTPELAQRLGAHAPPGHPR